MSTSALKSAPGAKAAAATAATARSVLAKRQRSTVARFCSIVKVVDGLRDEAAYDAARQREAQVEAASGSRFDVLADEEIAQLIAALVNGGAPPAHWNGAEYRKHQMAARNSAIAFALCTRRFARVMRTVAKREQAECLARGTVATMPRHPDAPFAFTEQARLELLSVEQRQMLKQAHCAMACHCASKCCSQLQRAFNRDLRKGSVLPLPTSPRLGSRPEVPHRLVAVLENCAELAVTDDGTRAFASIMMKREATKESYVRIAKIVQRGAESSGHFGGDSPMYVEEASVEFVAESALAGSPESLADVALYGPERMWIAPDGSGVACIVPLTHDTPANHYAHVAHSALFYWNGAAPQMVHVAKPQSNRRADAAMRNPQWAWFASSPAGVRLVVAWSTEYFDSYGSLFASDTFYADAHPGFQFATYSLDGPDGTPELVEITAAMPPGRLQECHPFSDGEQVLVVLEKASLGQATYMCDVAGDECILVSQAHWPLDGAFLGMGVAPMGDCVATVSLETRNGRHRIVLDLLDRVHRATYKHINRIDLTAHLTSNPYSGHSKCRNEDFMAYAVGFSPCGRFATVVDRRPVFGERPWNYGVVIVDTAMRHHGQGSLCARPLFYGEIQAPRGFFWTRSGIWTMPPGTSGRGLIGPAGGALCLFAPGPLSLT